MRKYSTESFRREIEFICRATPDIITGVDRLYLRRNLAADSRTKAVAGYQQIGPLTAAVRELNADTTPLLLHTHERVPEMIVLTIDGP